MVSRLAGLTLAFGLHTALHLDDFVVADAYWTDDHPDSVVPASRVVNDNQKESTGVGLRSAGVVGVLITNEGHPPADPVRLSLQRADLATASFEMIGQSFASGAMSEAAADVDSANGLVYMLNGLYDGVSVKYRLAAHSLDDGSLKSIYPLQQLVPFVLWTGFGQQMGFDASLGLAVVLAPTGEFNSSVTGPPYSYSLFAVDVKKNTTTVVKELGPVYPISEGYPATLDPTRHNFWFIVGDPNRALVGVNIQSGEYVTPAAGVPLGRNDDMQLVACHRLTGSLWSVGASNGTMTVFQLDPTSGTKIGATALNNIGSDWYINLLPGVATIDTNQNVLIVPAGHGGPEVFFVQIPLDSLHAAIRPTKPMCHLSDGGSGFNCPTALVYDSATQSTQMHAVDQ